MEPCSAYDMSCIHRSHEIMLIAVGVASAVCGSYFVRGQRDCGGAIRHRRQVEHCVCPCDSKSKGLILLPTTNVVFCRGVVQQLVDLGRSVLGTPGAQGVVKDAVASAQPCGHHHCAQFHMLPFPLQTLGAWGFIISAIIFMFEVGSSCEHPS